MGLDNITDGAEESYEKDRAEKLGLDDVDQLEDFEDSITRIKNLSSIVVAQDKRIEELESKVRSLTMLLEEAVRQEKDGSKTANPNGDGEVGGAGRTTDAAGVDGQHDEGEDGGLFGEDDDGESSYEWEV